MLSLANLSAAVLVGASLVATAMAVRQLIKELRAKLPEFPENKQRWWGSR